MIKLNLNRGPIIIFQLGSILFSILFLLFYIFFGNTVFHPSYEIEIFIFSIVVLLLSVFSFIYPNKIIEEVNFAFSLLAFIFYINTQLTYITNIFVGIDNTSISIGFVFNFLFGILSFSFILTSSILEKNDLPKLKGDKNETE